MHVFVRDNEETMRREAHADGKLIAFVDAEYLMREDFRPRAWFPFFLNVGPWKAGQMFGNEVSRVEGWKSEAHQRQDAIVERAHFDREFAKHYENCKPSPGAIMQEAEYRGWKLHAAYYEKLYRAKGIYWFEFTARDGNRYRIIEHEPGKGKLQVMTDWNNDCRFDDCAQDIEIILYGVSMILEILEGKPL